MYYNICGTGYGLGARLIKSPCVLCHVGWDDPSNQGVEPTAGSPPGPLH